jgi:ubiquinone/menaquinone biosynthesis C-methylase UbiE
MRLLMAIGHIRILLLLACSSMAFGQGEHPITKRKYAQVMGAAGAGWLERSEREEEENPDKAIQVLGLKPGMKAADVGAGTGYFTVRMAKLVGPEGKIYACDIQQQMLDMLRRRLRTEKIQNVELVRGTVTDPMLPKGTMDLILMVDVYHEFSEPQAMLRKMKEALAPEGRLVLLEFRKEDPSVPIRVEHKMSVAEVRAELEAEGFKLDRLLDVLPRQHIFIFRKQLTN